MPLQRANVSSDITMGDLFKKLLFGWNRAICLISSFATIVGQLFILFYPHVFSLTRMELWQTSTLVRI